MVNKKEIISLKNINYDILKVIDIKKSKDFTMDIEVDDVHYYVLPDGKITHNTASLVTQTTSGIEPVFMIFYKRRRKINPEENNVNTILVDQNNDSWTEYNIIHHGFIKWFNINYPDINIDNLNENELNEYIKLSPYYKNTTNEIDPFKKVELQSKIQQYIGHSISTTYNLPEDISLDKVNELYIQGWKLGLKGMTIYRENSRTGVLVSNTNKIQKKKERPKELQCDIHHVTANGQKYYVIVGLLDDKPYEIFAFSKTYIQIPQLRKDGKLIKIESGVYNLQYNGTIIENIARHFDSPQEDGFTRVVSRMLRNNIPIADICKDIDKSFSNVSSFYKAISRTLRKNYMNDSDYDLKGETCPECGAPLKMTNGCKECSKSCGYSRCE